MHTQSHKLWLGRLVALTSMALSASGCFHAIVGDGELCLEEDDAGNCLDDGGYADSGSDGYSDAGMAYSDSGAPGYADAGPTENCSFGGKEYPPGSFLPTNDCKCSCLDYGKITCNPECAASDAGVWPDDAEVSYDGGDWPKPGWADASVPSRDAGPADDAAADVCEYEGKLFQVGEYVPTDKPCAKCTCDVGGVLLCDASPCMMPSGCYLGEKLFSVGEVVTCSDGCNTCTCGSKTDNSNWFATKAACPALPTIMPCPAGASSSAFPAQLVYREGDTLAVVDSRCANGQTLDYNLCWDGDLSIGRADLYVFATGTQRACNAALGERVFSLLPLRQALVAAFPGQPDIKAGLQGSDSSLNYTFHAF